jgi:signal transduction histidine kinase
VSESRKSNSDSYEKYRLITEAELVPAALRNAVLIFILLQTIVFIPADWVIFPEKFQLFLTARLTLNLILCTIYFRTASRFPIASSVAVGFFGAALFVAMVYQTGGVESGYYVGFILLIIGIGVMIPLSGRQSFGIGSMIFASYALLPVYSKDPVVWSTFAQHLFFLGAACVEAGWASAYMDRMRFSDFKQKRELETARDELAELDRVKSRFSANIHHELRTPLTLILAPLDTLRSGDLGRLPAPVERMLATMHANGRRLHKMINNLLDLSKLESRQFKLHRRPMRLGALVDELITGARALGERKGVELVAEGFSGLPLVNGDPEALEKVLVNLVGNALKFTEQGDRICVSAEQREGAIAMAVSDTGLGIPADKLDSIFDRFAQVDASTTRRYEGTGIGLSLAKEMMELHGGRIWAESDGEGAGTTVHLLLPIGEPDERHDEEILHDDLGGTLDVGRAISEVEADLNLVSTSTSSESMIEMERTVERWEGGRPDAAAGIALPLLGPDTPEVLIVEDNPDMRALLKMIVGREFRVRVASNGREALDALNESHPDLVLTDLMMPEMSGIELCGAIKEREETRTIPVVLVTSKAEREMKIEGLEFGADDYVTKPFHPRELLARVRSLVRVRNLQKALAARNDALEQALTKLKQAQVHLVQSERLAAVGELAAGIAHEVNNPVNFALNAARAMESTVKELREVAANFAALDSEDIDHLARQLEVFKASEQQRGADELLATLIELAEIVGEGLKRTHSLVGDLRDFAAMGRSAEPVAGVDVEAGLLSTVQLLKHNLTQRNAAIDLDIAEGLPTIHGDSGALNQVFLNLIKNAAESFGEAGGSIQVTLASEGDTVVALIGDDGPGIPADVLPLIFDPFFTTKDAGEGTGLGLSISQNIISAHGGELNVESEVGIGTRFSIRLPISPPACTGTDSQ